jgi:hypothetical protein
MRIVILALTAFGLTGCIAQTALEVASLPVKVASAGVDAATTSQAEADRKRGEEIRKYEECLGREQRRAEKRDRDPDYSRCDRD